MVVVVVVVVKKKKRILIGNRDKKIVINYNVKE
jgi:hypothetical protein